MARPRREQKDDRLLCPSCERWLHHTRFFRRRRQTPNGTVWEYDATCRVCQQTARNEEKNLDRAQAIVELRAGDQARKIGVTRAFVMEKLNWQALVPLVRASMEEGATCRNCGHPYDATRDIQLEHVLPPRHLQDWARLHARNIAILCGSCNNGKGKTDYAAWLDDQEEARLSVQALNAQGMIDRDLQEALF